MYKEACILLVHALAPKSPTEARSIGRRATIFWAPVPASARASLCTYNAQAGFDMRQGIQPSSAERRCNTAPWDALVKLSGDLLELHDAPLHLNGRVYITPACSIPSLALCALAAVRMPTFVRETARYAKTECCALAYLIDRVQGGLDLCALLSQLVQDGHQPGGVLRHLAAANIPEESAPLSH